MILSTTARTTAPIAPWAWVFDGVLWAIMLIALFWGLPALMQQGTLRQHLSFQLLDANAMIPGTNVYWMGVNVGAVDEVVLTPHAAEVSIDMHRNLPPIPWGTHVSVAFTGLGGNKEVQLLPPETLTTFDQPRKVVVEPSQRLKQVLQVNTEVALYLKQGADGLSNLLGKAAPDQSVALLRHNIFMLDDVTHRARLWIGNSTPSLVAFQKKVHRTSAKARANMQQLSEGVSKLEAFHSQLKGTHPLQSTLTQLTQTETQLIRASKWAEETRATLQTTQENVAAVKSLVQPVISRFNDTPVPPQEASEAPEM
ncbi:MAG: MlaD family protein [Vampirovibrionales bacterium]|nr:MlaD family protein [Vampirovibrionales bacterium]